MGISIYGEDSINGEFIAPSSKPQTQRALIMAALSDGTSTIRWPLRSRETAIMIDACHSVGAKVTQFEDRFIVDGIGAGPGGSRDTAGRAGMRYIWAGGSALVARLFLTIGSALPENIVVDGTCNLRVRPFEPLIAALKDKGVELSFFDTQRRLPCTVTSTSFPGGNFQLGTDISSQFVTSLLTSAPLAVNPLSIELTGSHYSLSYIKQTTDMMANFGVTATTGDDMRQITVTDGQDYRATDIEIDGDYTSASYILGAAFVTRGHIKLRNLDPNSLQGERAVVSILAQLGARVRWIEDGRTIDLDCTGLPTRIDTSFDLSDSPNILPTVAAIVATIHGSVRITGGRLTQNHKSPRIEAIAQELGKAGVSVQILKSQDGAIDGLRVDGAERHNGDIVFSNHGDHRITMALMLFALACRNPCSFHEDLDTMDSFPGFTEFLGLSVK
jgi:3-phosphoshikimate 1-carboxyvinyltransferase